MGVTSQTFQFMMNWLTDDHKSICEFGDQQFLSCPPMAEKSYTRNYWKNKGYDYDSIDINGFGDSILMDLNVEVLEHKKQYDFLTDFGTFEHVNNFYMALKNMHNFCKVGGMMVHILPALGHWPNHGSWRAQRPFWIKLGKANGYKIRDVHEDKTWIGGHDSDQIYIVYEKMEDKEFVNKETFDTFGLIQAHELEEYIPGEIFYKNKNLYN
jgi:hypothetical protein